MGLFSASIVAKVNEAAAKSNEQLKPPSNISAKSVNDELIEMSNKVMEYFKDSDAKCVTTREELHEYVDHCIKFGYAGIDTETTGLDRINDHMVGASLYAPGRPEIYIPLKHLVPLFETPYKNQFTYAELGEELQRLADNGVKLIFANADFDLAMIYKDLKVDLTDAFYYDVISAWRCLREDEKDNTLKGLYAKYVKKGKVDPMKFADFFSPKMFPYVKPQVAALYAASDARFTYELFLWQLPYITPSNEKCKKHRLEKIANLIWNVEFPMVKVCAMLHRRGVFEDDSIASVLHDRYTAALHADEAKLAKCIQDLIDAKDTAASRSRPFRTGKDFNPNSNPHVTYLINKLLGSAAKSTGKEVLETIDNPAAKQILAVRGDVKLLGTYVDKLPKVIGPDHRIHAQFKSLGAATGRMSSEAPNMQNIPSHALDIRHMFRATPEQKEIVTMKDVTSEGFSTILSLYDKVPTPDGNIVVHDLAEGDVVIFKEGDLIHDCKIVKIENNEGKATLHFEIVRKEDNNI